MKPTPIATIRLCGAHTHHENETLAVVPDSEAAIRGIPGRVTIEQARSLVERGEAMWLDPLPDLKRRHHAEGTAV